MLRYKYALYALLLALISACSNNPAIYRGDNAAATMERSQAAAMECHGLLWLLDHLELHGTPALTLHAGLAALLNHPRCRLPRDEAAARLRRWLPE